MHPRQPLVIVAVTFAALTATLSAFAQRPDQPPAGRPRSVRGAEDLGRVTPFVFEGDLRDLEVVASWRPGDPVREIPRRYYPRPGQTLAARPEPASRIDPLLARQERVGFGLKALATPEVDVQGLGFSGVQPPDTVGDVGRNFFIQATNGAGGAQLAVYDKTDGSLVAGPTAMGSLGAGNCADGFGDPIVLYDELAGRWLLSELSAAGNRLCVYVSQTGDPVAGGWFNYDFQASNFPDYPKYAVWSDAYYVGTNEARPALYALERSQMLVGEPAGQQRFTAPALSGFGFQMLVPGDLDGATPPPAGSPAYFLRHRDDESHGGSTAGDFLEIFELSVDFTTPANSALTGPIALAVSEFDSNLCGLSSSGCVPQPGTGTRLDPLRDVVMQRLAYRNFGSHETLVGNFVTDVDGSDRHGIRWFELRKTGAGPWTLFQEGTFSPDASHRWMGAIAMDRDGNVALGYNVSSSRVSPGLRYTGRLAASPLGAMTQGETTLVDGGGSNRSNRYGDHSSVSVDPVDGCTFWLTGEYNPSSLWSTRIGSFRFDSCGCGGCMPAPSADATGALDAAGFGCTGEAFLVQNLAAELNEIDQTVDPFQLALIGSLESPPGIPIEVNNLGFRITDGLLYGVEVDLSSNSNVQILQIGPGGGVTGLGRPAGLPANVGFNAGDVSSDGKAFYLARHDVNTLWTVDLTGVPSLPAAVSVPIVGAGGGAPPAGIVLDWAHNPADGRLYGGDRDGAGGNAQIAQLDPVTGVRRDFTVAGLPGGAPNQYGGAWFDAAGRLFLFLNSGTIFEVDLGADLSNPTPTRVGAQGGPPSSRNDAAACIPPAAPPAGSLSLVKTGVLNVGGAAGRIDLVKSGILDLGADGVAGPGDAVTYSLTVTNVGGSALSDVLVSDPLLASVTCPTGAPLTPDLIPSLAVGASETCTGSYAITQADADAGVVHNTATASGTGGDGDAVSGQDSHSLTIPAGGFACTGEAFIVQDQNAQLSEIDQSVSPFVFLPIGHLENPPGTPIEVNGLGFRITDGLFYAAEVDLSNNTTSQIVRIGAGGATTGLGLPAGLPSNVGFNAGDVSSDGNTLFLTRHNVNTLWAVDLTGGPSLPAAGSVAIVGAGGGAPPSGVVLDWAYNPADGRLYGGDRDGAGGNAQIAQLDPLTGVRRDFTVAGLPGGAPNQYGGAWFDAAGRLFLFLNSGTIFEVDLGADLSNPAPTIAGSQSGPPSSRNDAAACIPPAVPLRVSPTSDNDFVEGRLAGKAQPGDLIDYTFDVTNSGGVTLTDVAISDAIVPAIVCPSGHPIPSLAPGASETCTGSYVVTQVDLDAGMRDNTATATGLDPGGHPVSAQDGDSVPLSQTPPPPPPPPPPPSLTRIACSGEAFLVQDLQAELGRIDQALAPFAFVPIGGLESPPGTPIEVNNLGFRRGDGLLYGLEVDLGANSNVQIVRVGGDGAVEGLGRPAGLPSNVGFNAGDVSSDGSTMYLNQSGRGTLYGVDLTTSPPTLAGSVAVTGPTTGSTSVVLDWASHPLDGRLYGADREGQVARLDPLTGVRTDFAVSDGGGGTLPVGSDFGGAWFDAAGRFFLFDNGGAIFEIDLGDPASPAPALLASRVGPGSSRNDAAACVQDVIGVAQQMNATTDGLPETVTLDYVFENLSGGEELSGLSAVDDLTSSFGVHGVDWTFAAIVSSPPGFANPGFDGHADTELVAPLQRLAAGTAATVTVTLDVLTVGGPAGPGSTVDGLGLEVLRTGLSSPVAITHAGDGRLFVTLQDGRVRIFDNGQLLAQPFLDIRDRVLAGGERGLFSVAFHPDYAQNGLFFVDYTNLVGDSVISRFSVSADPDAADASSEAILLTIPQPFANHNGGQLQFGPDGFLYVATGDGGSANDPGCRAQDTASLHGKLLRLDVDQNVATPPFHAVPASNPLVGVAGAREEIWSFGLRNPWRFSFDRATGDLYLGDVGQGQREEVDRQPAASSGGENYGWKVMEGGLCTGNTNGCVVPVPACNAPELTLPILDYSHAAGRCSITGGYVYRGSAIPQAVGAYFYGDFCTGELWAAEESGGVWQSSALGSRVPGLTSFGEGVDGELYLVAGGTLYRLTGPSGGERCNQVLVTGETPSGILVGDVSTEGLVPDPDGNGVPAERLPSCVNLLP